MSVSSLFAGKIRFLLVRIISPAILNGIYFFISRKERTLLLIKNDGIGDYILFRNYLYFLRNSAKYKHHQIYLLANLTGKDLAMHLDAKVIDGFFWYSDSYFLKWNLVKLLSGLQRLRLETIIYPNYSRKYTTDWLVKNIRAKNKIAVDGDCINEPVTLKHKTNSYYSELINVDVVPLHEFDRNKQIFEALTGEKHQPKSPVIRRADLPIVPNNSVVIFFDASSAEKKWSPVNFNTLCRLILSAFDTNIILIGGTNDEQEIAVISNGIPANKLSNRRGLDLIGLCALIGGANLLISGDTVAVHMAAALSVPAVCIAKGDLYGRFVPYPPHVFAKIYTVFPDGYIADRRNYGQYSSLDINKVRAGEVCQTIKKILTGRESENRTT